MRRKTAIDGARASPQAQATRIPRVQRSTRLRLTPRQSEIVALAAEGLGDKQIASALGLSHATVRAHLHEAYRRNGVLGRVGLIGRYFRESLPRESAEK